MFSLLKNMGATSTSLPILGVALRSGTQEWRSKECRSLTNWTHLIANEKLETNKKNIFVAWDVASYYDPLLRKQKRIEHHDNAFVTGKLAEQNMTGE